MGTWVLVLVLLVTGCAGSRDKIQKKLLADANPMARARDLDTHYLIRYPDVLAVEIYARPELSGSKPVGLDGRISFGDAQLAVDGRSTLEVARDIAWRLRLPYEAVSVHVEKHASQHLYLFGEVGEAQQVVAYRGPETIVDLLHRIGGGTPDSALNEIQVVRAHVANGKPPEVFHVDLDAILNKQDLSTNIRLEPFDRIHVGESRAKRMSCYMPPWFRLFCKKRDPSH